MGYGTSQRTKVHVVAVKREAYAKEKVKQIFLKMFVGGREDRGWKWKSLSGFLNFISGLWALSDLHTVPAWQRKKKKTSIQFLLFPLSPLSHCVCFCEPKFSGLFFLL